MCRVWNVAQYFSILDVSCHNENVSLRCSSADRKNLNSLLEDCVKWRQFRPQRNLSFLVSSIRKVGCVICSVVWVGDTAKHYIKLRGLRQLVFQWKHYSAIVFGIDSHSLIISVPRPSRCSMCGDYQVAKCENSINNVFAVPFCH